jgi:hypothetical protein
VTGLFSNSSNIVYGATGDPSTHFRFSMTMVLNANQK